MKIDLAEFVTLRKTKGESENSWCINVKDIDQTTFDLSAKNPNKKEEAALRKPQDILEEMKNLDEESKDILNSILDLLMKHNWEIKSILEMEELGLIQLGRGIVISKTDIS